MPPRPLSIYWQIFEDDQTCSALWQDLHHLIPDTAKYPHVHIRIHYHSKNAYGSYVMHVQKGKCEMEPMEAPELQMKKPDHAHVVRDLQQLVKTYSTSHQNVLILSGHITIYFKTDKWLSTDVMNQLPKNVHFDLIVMDSCTSSYWPWLQACTSRCDYLLGCESTSPYLGFVSPVFLDVLVHQFYGGSKKKNGGRRVTAAAKRWIDAYIQRNEKELSPYDIGRCDASMIDMKRFQTFVDVYGMACDDIIRYARDRPQHFQKAKIEFNSWYPLYDLVTLLEIADSSLTPLLEKCILYVKINRAQRKHLKRYHQTSAAYRGISMFLLGR